MMISKHGYVMNDLTWKTKDFYSAVLCRANGIPLVNLAKQDGNFVVFNFASTPEVCEEILRKHWNRELKLETRLLIDTIAELKTRTFSEMKHGNGNNGSRH